MADITVIVNSPGSFTTWGQDTWSSGTFGQDSGTQLSQGNSLGAGFIEIGWGGDTWGENQWGELANETFIAPSFSLGLTLGNFTAEGVVTQGWGGDTWGENLWGNLIPSVVTPSGMSASMSIGEMAYTGSEEGWGSRTWGRGSWGIAGSVLAANFELPISVGSVTAEGVVTQGWGGDTWGENYWGELITSVVVVSPTQLGMTTAIGDLAYAQVSDGWGRDTWGSSSWGIFGDVLLGQLPMTSSLGSVTIDAEINAGWGANSWGNGSWGSEFAVTLSSLTANMSIGDEAGGTSFTHIVPNGLFNMQTFLDPRFSVSIDGAPDINVSENDIFVTAGNIQEITGDGKVEVTGIGLTGTAGQAVGGTKTPVDVDMTAMTLGFNPASLTQDTIEQPTGILATLSLGDEGDIPQVQVGVSGIDITVTPGNIPEINGDGKVVLTGIELTTTANNPNIFSWNEIDLGVNNVWTEVDLAA